MRRIFFVLIFGIGGFALLVSLGVWQVQRLNWKLALIADREARLMAPEIALPLTPDEQAQEYRAVTVTGTPVGDEAWVIWASDGYRVITAFETDEGRKIMVDMGVLPLERQTEAPAKVHQTIIGNMIWPDDGTHGTSVLPNGHPVWLGRDVAPMAEALGTEPLMVVLAESSALDPRLTPAPVDRVTLRNNHLEYAITWFLLAFVWAIMSIFYLRTAGKKD